MAMMLMRMVMGICLYVCMFVVFLYILSPRDYTHVEVVSGVRLFRTLRQIPCRHEAQRGQGPVCRAMPHGRTFAALATSRRDRLGAVGKTGKTGTLFSILLFAGFLRETDPDAY